MRLRVSNISEPTKIYVAKIELVGNEWQELGVAADSSSKFSKANADSIFSISVINTDDNANYRPPEGVKGEFDRINQIRSKEQSLVLKFDQLPGRASGFMAAPLALPGNWSNFKTSDCSFDRI